MSFKYDLYKNFSQKTKQIKPHQILAIYRGEEEKELSVKVEVPVELWIPVRSFCLKKWSKAKYNSHFRKLIIEESIEDSIKRLRKKYFIFLSLFKNFF